MNRLNTVLLATALMGMGTSAIAADMTKDKGMTMDAKMKMMDSNGDGMISKGEYMKHHEMMFDKMKKNADGMVMLQDMKMMHGDMMK